MKLEDVQFFKVYHIIKIYTTIGTLKCLYNIIHNIYLPEFGMEDHQFVQKPLHSMVTKCIL